MDEVVFVQVKEKDVSAVAGMLGKLDQVAYQFVVLPLDTKLLSKEMLIELIEGLK